MYRMGVLAMLFKQDGVDASKCVQMALLHDLAEVRVGDLTPLCGVSDAEKKQLEHDAIAQITHELLGNSPEAAEMRALWTEYEERATPEALLVKDLDRFELCLQTFEYERGVFRASSIAHTRTRHTRLAAVLAGRQPQDSKCSFCAALTLTPQPRIRTWVRILLEKRNQMWQLRNVGYVGAADTNAG